MIDTFLFGRTMQVVELGNGADIDTSKGNIMENSAIKIPVPTVMADTGKARRVKIYVGAKKIHDFDFFGASREAMDFALAISEGSNGPEAVSVLTVE
jgi:hypothetical protein